MLATIPQFAAQNHLNKIGSSYTLELSKKRKRTAAEVETDKLRNRVNRQKPQRLESNDDERQEDHAIRSRQQNTEIVRARRELNSIATSTVIVSAILLCITVLASNGTPKIKQKA